MEITEYTTRALFVPAPMADMVRGLCIAMAGEGPAGGMFRTPVYVIGESEPSWFVTDGPIDVQFAEALESPEAMYKKCIEQGVPATLEQCQAILGACIVAPGDTSFAVMAERGLELHQLEEPMFDPNYVEPEIEQPVIEPGEQDGNGE